MKLSLFDRIQARIELFRLEQRYTRHRNRRSTFVSNAIYVDGEYIYQSPTSTGSTTNASSVDASSPTSAVDNKPGKRLNRFSSMPGFGSLSRASGSRSNVQDWRDGAGSDGGNR